MQCAGCGYRNQCVAWRGSGKSKRPAIPLGTADLFLGIGGSLQGVRVWFTCGSEAATSAKLEDDSLPEIAHLIVELEAAIRSAISYGRAQEQNIRLPFSFTLSCPWLMMRLLIRLIENSL